MFDYRRSHTCGALRKNDVGKTVTLSGWVHRRRDHGGLIFIDLRDRYGLTQLVFDPEVNRDAHTVAGQLRSEWVISIRGEVLARGAELVNAKLPTGEIEIAVSTLEILSHAKTPPFSICDEMTEVGEELRLKYRFLDIRRGELIQNLLVRHQAMLAARNYLDTHAFCEVQTPILARSTPEGARDYLVPSRIYPGHFYALPQSPQIFKQLLMVSGLDRYYQIAPCFRDEDLRADRQPEFTQIDLEMSFAQTDDLFPLIEGLMAAIFKKCLKIDIPTPFRRMRHSDALMSYGTDKPDLRFGMEFKSLEDIAAKTEFGVFLEQLRTGGAIKGICVKGGADLSRKEIDNYTTFVGRFGAQGLAWMKMTDEGLSSSIVKFFPEAAQKALIQRFEAEGGDLIFMVAAPIDRTNQALDHLRRKIARDRSLITPGHYEFLWVTEFPLLKWNAQEHRLETEHHPFTAPHPEDIALLDTRPEKARSGSYDLVLNGYELGSGSPRIFSPDLQEKIFTLLKLSPDEIKKRFGFFVDALKYGTPPHLGIGIGFDRLIMILCNTDNIRDVVAFPKTQRATDLMMEAPSEVLEEQLHELKLQVERE
ncbi:MAG: aspartate--tRNA ligase [Parachlamydiales bacterium]